jgi:hypothetical protein
MLHRNIRLRRIRFKATGRSVALQRRGHVRTDHAGAAADCSGDVTFTSPEQSAVKG